MMTDEQKALKDKLREDGRLIFFVGEDSIITRRNTYCRKGFFWTPHCDLKCQSFVPFVSNGTSREGACVMVVGYADACALSARHNEQLAEKRQRSK